MLNCRVSYLVNYLCPECLSRNFKSTDLLTGIPSSPQNLHVVETDSGRISLEWKPSIETATAPVDEYIIEMAEGNSKNFVEVAKVDGGTCTFDATGLKDGQKYNFRIKAQNQAGTSERSAQLDKPATTSAVGKELFSRRHLTNVWTTTLYVMFKMLSESFTFMCNGI